MPYKSIFKRPESKTKEEEEELKKIKEKIADMVIADRMSELSR